MSDDERKGLQRGDRVLVRLDNGEQKEFTVKYAPWQLGDGTWVVGLAGIAGGYWLDRVEAVLWLSRAGSPWPGVR